MAATLGSANLVAMLDPTFYADPSKLWNAPAAAMPPALISISGNTLSLGASAAWIGTYSVTVTANEGHYSLQQTFNVTQTAAPAPPVLTKIANQTMGHAAHTLTLNLAATDAANKALTFSAQVLPINGQTPAVAVSLQGTQLTIKPASVSSAPARCRSASATAP